MKLNVLANSAHLNLRGGITNLFVWWWGELRTLIPQSLAKLLGGELARVVVRMGADKSTLVLSVDGVEDVLGSYQRFNDAELDIALLREAIAQKVPPDAVVSVELAETFLLNRRVVLPLVTETTLDQVIRFELDRFTPFKPDQVGFSCRLVERIPERDKLKVELYVVRRDYLQELLAELGQIGLTVNAVYPSSNIELSINETHKKLEADNKSHGRGFFIGEIALSANLLPLDLQPSSMPLWHSGTRLKLLGLVLLLGFTLIFPVVMQNFEAKNIEADIASIRSTAKGAAEQQRLLSALLEGQEILADKKNGYPAKLENIRDLTELLPDATWVSKLVINGSGIKLQGESSKSSDLIGIFEQTRRFKNVEFASPVTRNRGTDLERYEIRMQLVDIESAGNVISSTQIEAN